MTPQLMIAALRQGSNGAEILNILNTITGGEQHDSIQVSEPTLEEIQFWYCPLGIDREWVCPYSYPVINCISNHDEHRIHQLVYAAVPDCGGYWSKHCSSDL